MIKFIRGSIIFSMVSNPLSILLSVFTTFYFHTPIIFLIFSCIYGTAITWVVGALALRKLKTAQSKQELKTTAIFTLAGNNPLAGFLMLIMKDEQYATYKEEIKLVDEQNRVYVPVRIDDK